MLPIVRALIRHRAMLLPLSFLMLCLAGFTGCGKTDSATNSQRPTPGPQPAPILKFHWLGKNRLATEANATNFMAIWNLPESAKLEAQTLDKLATAPWRLWQTNVAVSNAPTALLRPLLEDLVNHEVYVEAQGDTNQPASFVLAIRLPADRAALWQSNFPIVLRSLSAGGEGRGEVATPTFNLQLSTWNLQFTLSRSNDWTLLSFTPSPLRGEGRGQVLAATLDPLLASFCSRIAADKNPFAPRATNYLVEAHLDVPRLFPLLSLSRGGFTNATTADLIVFGDGQNLRLRGGLDFLQPLSLHLTDWNVPTNLIRAPLVGFTAWRGASGWLESLGFWREKQLGAAPDQLYFWSQKSAPWLHFFAARSPAVTPQFLALKDYILDSVNLALALNRTGEFAWQTNENKVAWKGVPFCSPTFVMQDDLIVGGFSDVPPMPRPMPPEFLQQLQRGTNLVYYDWELTGEQLPSWTQILQLMRMAFSCSQLSIKDAGLPWLNLVSTNLDYSVTTVTLDGNRSLTFARAATLGLNSVELQLFVDWLDSPDFPLGLHTFNSPRDYISDRTRPPGLKH